MHINLQPTAIISGSHRSSTSIPPRLSTTQKEHMKSMSRYQVNLAFQGSLYNKGASYRRHLKESLRQVCDALMDNKLLTHLAIKIPCRCNRRNGDQWTSQALTTFVEDLEPLKRLRVVMPVTFLLANSYIVTARPQVCHEPTCLQLADCVQTQLGRLDGEELSHREKKWKMIKELGGSVTASRRTRFRLTSFWIDMNEGSLEEFDARAESTMQRLRRRQARSHESG